jgi:heme-degrading monooxygenase HmoA
MKFKPEHIPAFLENFEKNKEKIRGFEGCEHLQLLHDIDDPSIYFTYSFWHEQADLENYRKSELFKTVWSYTKTLFDAKPEAWSVEQAVVMP